jgi:hypothetical protein
MDKKKLAEAMFELQCIAEIMSDLGRGKRDTVPAPWLDWLSICVARIAANVGLGSAQSS